MLNLFESKKLKTVSVIEIGVSPSIMVEKNNKTYVRWQNWTKTTSVHSFEKFEKNTTETISMHTRITGLKSLLND